VTAANIMLERGYRKPEQKNAIDVVHCFAAPKDDPDRRLS
jgi:hypothetical protein